MIKLIILSAAVFGVSKAIPTRESLKIIGGNDTNISQHPWQASILSTGDGRCGASLIAPQWIVTAAHCINNKNITSIRVGSNSSTSGGQEVLIEDSFIYPFVPERSLDGDIGLLRLQNPVSGPDIQPIALPSGRYSVEEGVVINVAGWGKMDPIEVVFPKILQEVSLPIVDQTVCQNIYGSMVLPLNVTENMFCAGYLGEGGKAPCYGDSGSPAVYNNEIVGIVSWGFKCAEPGYPAVFVKVANYVDWITETINNN